MKFTFNWLKDHLETDRPLSDIVDKLSMIGLEVEGVNDQAEALASFRVAYVVSAEKHPDADRLQVCMVDYGDGDPVHNSFKAMIVIDWVVLGASIVPKRDGIGAPTKPARKFRPSRMKGEKLQ